MDDSEKTKRLVEDYQKAQRALDDLNDQYNSEEYLLGRMIRTNGGYVLSESPTILANQ